MVGDSPIAQLEYLTQPNGIHRRTLHELYPTGYSNSICPSTSTSEIVHVSTKHHACTSNRMITMKNFKIKK
ncbi:hypothetical protein RB195_002089 [Necator americanus]|uniref:Uncharacterized protein n=1 Tax=Necator americanus TaxID=51031 RepID=A0ABR1DI32_NECAM